MFQLKRNFSAIRIALIITIFSTILHASDNPDDELISISKELKFKDYTLHAGQKSPTYPELVRANQDGSCDFRLYQPVDDVPKDGYFRTSAKSREQIKEGTSDFYGFVISCNYSKQEATVRVFDISGTK